MARIHLVEGPVGAGKSTFAAQLALEHQAVHLNLDEWMVTLFSEDRPETAFLDWYAERKDRCLAQIWAVTCELMQAGTGAILELGLVQAPLRDAFYARVDAADYPLDVYLLDAPKEIRRQRVTDRNLEQGQTFRMTVSDEIFELADGAWQPPDDTEIRDRTIKRITSG